MYFNIDFVSLYALKRQTTYTKWNKAVAKKLV